MNKNIPITLLTGYLGSGKTTLINYILKNNNDKKIAIIVNDIGTVNVDASLIEKDGIVSKKDESLARQYFEKAASRGDNRASFNLAMMEEQKKNYMGAYQWYELSTRDGMLDNKVITLSEGKKTALAANLTHWAKTS